MRVGALVVFVCGLGSLSAFGGEDPPPDLQRGLALLDQGKYQDALKALKKAHAAQKKRCAPCLVGMAEAQLHLGQAEEAVESCEKALELGLENVTLRTLAWNVRGLALARQAGKGPSYFPAAEDSFRKALEVEPDDSNALFNLGFVLMQQSRDEEGIVELKRYLDHAPTASGAARASALIANPRRARERFAPEATFKTLDGEVLTLKSLAGRIVLLDFWATWCPPCRAAIPELKDLTRKYAPDRVTLISISVDEDEGTWRSFIDKHKMSWPQCRDVEGTLSRLFRVRAFPTYLVIDGEGIIRKEISGTDPQQSVGYRLRSTLAELSELKVP